MKPQTKLKVFVVVLYTLSFAALMYAFSGCAFIDKRQTINMLCNAGGCDVLDTTYVTTSATDTSAEDLVDLEIPFIGK